MVGNKVGAKRVLIIGGGASGLMVAIQIASQANSILTVDIAEPSEFLGRGLAYGTSDVSHLLNVPAGRMSIFPKKPNHFLEWLKADENTFAPRREYGRYLLETFVELQTSRNYAVFEHKRLKVTDLQTSNGSWEAFSDGQSFGIYDFVVLAIGHGKPMEVDALNALKGHERYSFDPWRNPVPEGDGVLAAIGTGLTFVDFALSHLRRNPKNSVFGVSRNGLLPESHLEKRSAPLNVPSSAKSSPHAIRSYISSSEDWRAAQDGVRHDLPEIWNSWSDENKIEFFADYLRWWNVHRHRVAPVLKQELDTVLSSGRLQIIKDQVVSSDISNKQMVLFLQNGKKIEADYVVNCLGYGVPGDDSLLGKLLERGYAASASLGMGIRTAFPKFNVLKNESQAWPNLFALGPILLGERFETTAIPELREQAYEIAAVLTRD